MNESRFLLTPESKWLSVVSEFLGSFINVAIRLEVTINIIYIYILPRV